MNNLIHLIITLLLLQTTWLQAQMIGGRENGQQAPATAKAAQLSSGGVSGDVNLFNGTFATSYDLGTVTTPGGLNFTATMSYSSSFASGSNLSNTVGIPYGAGWKLDIPMITISTEDYNQYTPQDLNRLPKDEDIPFSNISNEGRLYWYAPILNIPGVANGRMVYKYTDKYQGLERAVFVLHQFERYIEARFDGSTWEVLLDDGTVYHFDVRQGRQRNANNRRIDRDKSGSNVGAQITPKVETVAWYVKKITHPNKHGDIYFLYDVFGKFDMFKEFKQYYLLGGIRDNTCNASPVPSEPTLMNSVYKDIFLKTIETDTERLEFDYRSMTNTGLYPVVAGDKLSRFDSLYTKQVVASWGVGQSGFNSWTRYKHLKADGPYVNGTSNTALIGPNNPYIGKIGPNPPDGVCDNNYLYAEGVTTSDKAIFDHGFLESPLFNSNLSSGDMYEIRIQGGPKSVNCNLDINIVAGDNSFAVPQTYYNGNTQNPFFNSWNERRKETIFSTFNQAIKWNMAGGCEVDYSDEHGYQCSDSSATQHGFLTSNFFSMPNLLNEYGGIRIQVGPGNADVDYSSDPHEVGIPLLGHQSNTGIPRTCNTYLYEYICNNGCPSDKEYLWDGHNVTPNFGIGLPWHMVNSIYSGLVPGDEYCATDNNIFKLNFWWENERPNAPLAYPNKPTLADENTSIKKVELIRYVRNPYMLYRVKHTKLNGAQSTDPFGSDGWQLVAQQELDYQKERLPNYIFYKDTIHDGGNVVFTTKAVQDYGDPRDAYLLKDIKQLPIESNATYNINRVPTTHFKYDTLAFLNPYGFLDTLPFNASSFSDEYISANHALLTEITDPLGKLTQISYQNFVGLNDFNYRQRKSFIPYNPCPSSPVKPEDPFSTTFSFLVGTKTITDADGTRQWDYAYSDLKVLNEQAYLPLNISWDRQFNTKYGYGKTTVTGPELNSGNRPYTVYHHHNVQKTSSTMSFILHSLPLGISEREDLLRGKLYKVEQYDGQNNLLSKTETKYDFQKAFLRGSKRVRHTWDFLSNGSSTSQGNDYKDVNTPNYANPDSITYPVYSAAVPTSPTNITQSTADAIRAYHSDNSLPQPTPVSETLIRYWIAYYKTELIPYYLYGISTNYYFDDTQKPDHILQWASSIHPYNINEYATVAEYDTAVALYQRYSDAFSKANQLYRSHYYLYDPNYTVPGPEITGLSCGSGMAFYETEYETLINNWHPYYLDSYFIKTTQKTETAYDQTASDGIDSIQTITEYEYYDADTTGITNSEGYEILLHEDGNTNNWQQLQWEPSWQLYKTRTYSPQHPDAFSKKEYFYYYDMINRDDMPIDMVRGLWDGKDSDNGDDEHFYPVHWSWKYKMRGIPFEERVTTQAPGQDAVTTSTYFTYSNKWNDALQHDYQENITLNTCTGNPSDTIVVNAGGDLCYRPIGTCEPVAQGFYIDYIDGRCRWCISNESDSPLDTVVVADSLAREFVTPFPHKDNLFYASTHVKTTDGVSNSYESNFPTSGKDKYAILRFKNDGNNNNNFLPEYPFDTLKTHEVLERNIYGTVQLEQDEKQLKTRYDYTNVKRQRYKLCINGVNASYDVYEMDLVNVPKSITVGAGLPDSLTTYYRYHPDYSVDSIIDPNDKVLSYEYDIYGRLKNTYLNGDKTGTIAYSQWNNDTIKTFQNRMLDNYVQTTTYNDVTGSKKVVARAYVDPLGRSAITATHKGATPSELVMAGGIDYDNWDRQTHLYKPYLHTDNFSSLYYDMHRTLSPSNAKNQYENTPRSRLLKSAKYDIAITDPNHTIDNAYTLMTGTEVSSELGLTATERTTIFPGTVSDYRLMRTKVTDEDGKTAIEYTNAVGQKVATLRNDGTNDIVTLFHYDSQGQLIEVINPEKQSSTYTYNLLGQLYEKMTVDNDTTRYVYNKSGQIVYEQDANHAAESYMRSYQYDEFGRNTIQAKYLALLGVFNNFDASKSMHWRNPNAASVDSKVNSPTFATLEKRFCYGDDFDATATDIAPEVKTKLEGLSNEKGQLSHSVSYNDKGKPIEYRFMSYNDEGYLDWEAIQFHAEGISTPPQNPTEALQGNDGELMPTAYGNIVIIDLPEYNLQGSLQTQNIDLKGDGVLDFQYHYTYDEFNRLEEVYAGYDNQKAQGYKVASYTYDDALGLVEEVKYYASDKTHKNVEADVITHTYDIRDRLTELDAGLFNWKMFYDANNASGAQSPTTSWNGNINSTVANYKFSTATNVSELGDFTNNTTYAYTYDGINRLTAANAAGVIAGQANLGDVTYSYDKIGNLKTLNRYIPNAVNNSVKQQNYNYVYQTGTNRLLKVEVGADRYTYDQNGNMISDTKKNLNNTIYGRANLPSRLDMATDTVTYIYDANDMRIYKKVDSVGTMLKQEYYLRDATGRELAVINNTDGATWYIYGKERIASTRAVPKLNVKVWLEGAYEKDTMRTTLNQRGLLPGQTPGPLATPTPAGQPYNVAPWNYAGNENITDYDPDVVDWVLLSLRKDLVDTSQIFRTAALLHKNGQVKLASNIALPELTDSVYIVIEHRNHSGIISAQKVNTLDYDFTLANSYSAVAAGQKEIVTGVWAMFAGNAVTDGQQDDINGDDKSTWAENNGKFDYYTPSDFNLDSDVNGSDKLLWAPNNGVFSAAQVSIGGISPPAELAVPQFIYYLYDHLGNTRVTYSVDIKTTTNIDYTVQSASDYYPYGKALRSYGKERYQSTYHERDVESGFDYRGARFYDGDVARFNSLDPLAAEFPEWSDYNYVLGNPIVFIDPNGKNTIYYNENGEELHRSEDGLDDAIVIISNGNLDAFYAEWNNVDVCSSECETHFNGDNVNSRLRGLGMNYLVTDMVKVLEYGYSLGTSTDYSVDGTTLIDANTGAIIPLYSEIRGDLTIYGNKVVLKDTDFSVGQPNTVALSGVFPDIHSHTNGFISEESHLYKDNETGSIYPAAGDFGGSSSAPPSVPDQSSVTGRMNLGNNTNVRSVVVSPTHLHLYNGSSSQNVKAPISFFNQ